MKVLFCNIANMLHYEGQTSRDITPTGAGKWVRENSDAHEKWNFLNYNGFCYGFVQNPGQFHIERFEGVSSLDTETDNVIVVWCAPQPEGKTTIVGWYENATMYRDYQVALYTNTTGLDRYYFIKAKSEDCYLLPPSLRNFEIERASVAGSGKGFGQQNYWYAESAYAQTELIPRVVEFLNAHKTERINRINSFFNPPENLFSPLSKEEAELADTYYDNNEYALYLPLAYRSFYQTNSADTAFYISNALKELFQFDAAIEWANKLISIEGKSWDSSALLVFLYQQTENYEKSISEANELLSDPRAQDSNIRCELYGVIADCLKSLNKLDEGIVYLDKIIAESNDKNLTDYTKDVKENWLTLIG